MESGCDGGPMQRTLKREADAATKCPVEVTLGLVGGKWKSLVIWHLCGRTLRFSELSRAMPGVTAKMLTMQLRELETSGLVKRTIYAEVPPRVEYSLTSTGQSLRPILEAMYAWGAVYMAKRGEEPTCGMDPPKDGAVERLIELLQAAQFQGCCGD